MNKNQNWRRVLSLLFAMVMLVSMMVVGSVVASAEESVSTESWDDASATETSVAEVNYLAEVQAKLEAGESVVLDRDIVITDYSFVHVCNLPSNTNGQYGLNAGNGAIFHITKPGVVLDLNGHSIVWDAHDAAYCNKRQVSLFQVTGSGYAGETADFTVIDSVGTGKVDIYGMPSAMYVVLATAKATISGGTWTNYPCNTCEAWNIFMYPSHGGALYISGGTFEQKVEDPYLLYAVVSSKPYNGNSVGVDYDQTKVVITGGNFVGTNPGDIKFQDISSQLSDYNACEEGFAPKQNADGTWDVVEVLLTVDGVPYDNWDEALENMKGDSFIKLYGDINNPYASKFGTNAAGKTRTLDLNGHNFTSNFFGISASATIHVMDSVGGGSMKVEYIVLYHNGYLSLDSNVNFTSVININYYSDAQPSTGAVYIDGVKVFGRGHFSLEDGIVGNVGAAKITLKNGLADITLTSGNFVLNEDVITPADQNLTIKTTLTVNAGVTLTIDPATNVSISGNGVIKGEGTIAVSSREHLLLVLEKTEIKNVHIGASFELDGVTLSGADMNYTGAENLLNSGVGITAGTFDADVKSRCPEGYCVPEENGVWTVLSAHNYDAGVETAPTYEADGFTTYTCENCGDYYVVVDEGSMLVLATVEMNGVKYPTIYDALNVLQPRETATIKFLEDYTFTADQRMFSNYTIVINAEYVTLDLNGKTITFDYTGSTSTCYASIAIYNKGTLTIMDSSEEKTGTLYSKTAVQGKDGPRILWITSAGVATIEGGNFISEQGDTMFYTSNSNAELPTCLYIKGGYFEHTIPTHGSEYRYFNQQNGYQKQIIEISGGTFKHNPTDGEMQYEEGFGFAENPDGSFGVRPHVYDAGVYTAPTLEADGFTTYTCVDCGVTNVVTHAGTMLVPVAEVNGVVYASLQEAINACKNGETVKVLVDLVFGADDVVYAHGGATGFGDYDQYNPTIFYVGGTKGVNGAANQPSDVNVVIDLNGHSLTNTVDTYFFMFMDNCKVTFKDSVGGGMLYAKAEAPVIWVVGTETLVTIESGYYLTDSATGVLHCTHGGDLVIEGGEFETTASDASLLLMLNTKDRQNSKFFIKGVATITIKGGNFHGFNPAKVGDDNGATSLEDIKFVDGCDEGFCPVLNADGTYGVAEELTFKGARLLLKDGIGIYFMLNTADLVETNYVAVFTFGGKTVEVPFANWKHFTDRVNTGILFDGVDAKSIATEVSVVIYSNGMAVSETQKMSVKAYAQAILAGNYADDAKELAKALINYGTIANDAISGNQTAEDVKNTVDADFAVLGATMNDASVTGNGYYGSSVNLNTYLGFNFKFLANAVKGATHAVITYNGKTVVVDASVFTTETKKGNELVVIELEQLLASDAAFELTCTVYNGETELATATDSVYNYCARALAGLAKMDGTAYEAQKYKSEFYKALVLYVEAAKGYTEAIAE